MNKPYDYFYGAESEQFSFFRIPKALYSNERFKDLTDGAKLLYGMMLDRMGLSIKNKWLDKQGRVYIIFTLEDIQELMNCKHEKAGKMLASLDIKNGVGLIERVKRGLGKPDLIYVRKFMDSTEAKSSEKQNSGNPNKTESTVPKNRTQGIGKTAGNNNDVSYNDGSNNDSNNTDGSDACNSQNNKNDISNFNQSINQRDAIDKSDYKIYSEIVKKNIDYDHLVRTHSNEEIDGIVSIMLHYICSNRDYVRVNKSDYPADVVKSRLLKLNARHVEYALECINNCTTKKNNIRSYKLTTLYNAPDTIDAYYTSRVNHDLYRENPKERYA